MRAFGRLFVALAALLAVTAAPRLATAEPADPIDTALDQCLAVPAGQTTQGMVECLDTAYRSWDTALNAAYKDLMGRLDADSAGKLKAAQRKWIVFRDAERDFLGSLQKPLNGTLMRVIAVQGMVDMVKARTLQLRTIAQSHG